MPTVPTPTYGDTITDANGNQGIATHDPNTGAPLPQDNTNGIVTSGSSRRTYNQNSSDLQNALNAFGVNDPSTSGTDAEGKKIDIATFSDPYTQMLDKMKSTSDLATKNLIATIQAQRANRGLEVTKETDRYKRGLQLLGIQSGQLEVSPELVHGGIMQAENAKMAKLQELDQAEATALLEANQARDDKDFKLLNERMDYIKQIKAERLNTLKDTYETLQTQKGIADIQAEQIYTQLQKLGSADKELFLQEVARKFNIPVGSLVSSVADVGVKKAKESAGTKSSKLSVSEVKSLQELYPDAGIDFGMTEADAEALIQGGDTAASEKTITNIKDQFTTDQLWTMAIKNGVEHNVNFSRKDEIDKFLTNDIAKQIQEALDNNHTTQDIYDYFVNQ